MLLKWTQWLTAYQQNPFRYIYTDMTQKTDYISVSKLPARLFLEEGVLIFIESYRYRTDARQNLTLGQKPEL